jgi:hypothetical protein
MWRFGVPEQVHLLLLLQVTHPGRAQEAPVELTDGMEPYNRHTRTRMSF